MHIFGSNKIYTFDKIVYICNKNDLITVDCLKEERMISIEKYNNGELGDCIFEFDQLADDKFLLRWFDPNYIILTVKVLNL